MPQSSLTNCNKIFNVSKLYVFNFKVTNTLLVFLPRNSDNCSRNFLNESRSGLKIFLRAHTTDKTYLLSMSSLSPN